MRGTSVPLLQRVCSHEIKEAGQRQTASSVWYIDKWDPRVRIAIFVLHVILGITSAVLYEPNHIAAVDAASWDLSVTERTDVDWVHHQSKARATLLRFRDGAYANAEDFLPATTTPGVGGFRRSPLRPLTASHSIALFTLGTRQTKAISSCKLGLPLFSASALCPGVRT